MDHLRVFSPSAPPRARLADLLRRLRRCRNVSAVYVSLGGVWVRLASPNAAPKQGA